MRTLPKSELLVLLPRSQIRTVACALRAALSLRDRPRLQFASHSEAPTGAVRAMIMRLFSAPKICTAQERHVRRPTWTDLFFDLVFAAAIAQLSAPLSHDYSFYGVARFTFLLLLVFLAWFGYTAFSTQFAVDDVVERMLIVVQVFLIAVMAANATDALSSRDAAGFGAAYGGVRAILALQYARVIRLPDAGSVAKRRIAGLFVAAILWAVSALLPVPQRYAGWAVALLIDIGNSWPVSRSTTASPPGATHFPERFGLLTIILLGEFVASVMRGIEGQMGWSFLAASAAVLSLALGFAIWSCYSDGAMGWEARHVRSHKDVVRLRAWIALHFALFLGIGTLGVGVRRAIALPPGEHFGAQEQSIICAATACLILVIMGIGTTYERHAHSRRQSVWLSQAGIALLALALAPLSSKIIATALLLLLFLCFAAQIVVLIANRRLLAGRCESGWPRSTPPATASHS
jgi:low temperature requirement protein LtrA